MVLRDIMYTRLYTIAWGRSIEEAAKKMVKHNIGSILVEEGGQLKGIITAKDFVAKVVAANKDPLLTPVEEVMSTPLIMIDAETNIIEAAQLLDSYKIKRLIVTENEKPVGIVSASLIGANIKRLFDT